MLRFPIVIVDVVGHAFTAASFWGINEFF
jgi:hypothetical protein